MAYNYNTFLKPLNTGDKNVLIFNESGELVYTLNPFSVTNTQVRGNVITISVKSGRTILLDFLNSNYALNALPILQDRIKTLTREVPNFIDKQVENWVLDLENNITSPTIFGTLSMVGDIVPVSDYTYNLGSPTHRWNNIYVKDALVASQSLYLGSTKLSSSEEGQLLITQVTNFGETGSTFEVPVSPDQIFALYGTVNDSFTWSLYPDTVQLPEDISKFSVQFYGSQTMSVGSTNSFYFNSYDHNNVIRDDYFWPILYTNTDIHKNILRLKGIYEAVLQIEEINYYPGTYGYWGLETKVLDYENTDYDKTDLSISYVIYNSKTQSLIDLESISTNVLPDSNKTRDLGATDSMWSSLYVNDIFADDNIYLPEGKSLFIGGLKFSTRLTGTSDNLLTILDQGYYYELTTQKYLSFERGISVIVSNGLEDFYVDDDYYDDANGAVMISIVDSYNESTGVLGLYVERPIGLGRTASNWTINISGRQGDTSGGGTASQGATGPQGPQGEQAGNPTLNLTFSSVGSYSVSHNSGAYPLIQILDDTGSFFIPNSIIHTSTSSFDVFFATGSTGTILVGGSNGPQGPEGPFGGMTATASFVELTVTGPSNIQQVIEVLTTATAAFGLSPSTFNLDFDDGSIFYVEPEGDNFVANYLNVPTTDNRIISTTIIISQTASAYIPDTVIINGDIIPISWTNGSLPSGNANQTDIVGFSFMRIGATWSKVFGQLSTFTTI